MALTRITTASIGSNVVSADKMQNAAIQARHFQSGTITLDLLDASANTAASEIRLNANIDVVQDNVAINQTAVNTVHSNVVAAEANVVLAHSNADIANANTIQINSNLNIVSSNVDGVEARRVANLASVTFSGQVNMSDDLVIAGNLIVSGDTTTANSINMVVQDRLLMLANSATGTPAADVGLLFNRGNQGNAAFFYDESATTFKISDTKDPSTNTAISPVTSGNLDVGIITAATIKYNGADLNTSITDNVATLTTNINTLDANADAIESRRVTNVSVAASNDFVTFTRLNANINVVSGNVEARNTQLNANLDVVQDNVAALSGGAVLLTPFTNVNTSTSTSNVFFLGKAIGTPANVLYVSIDGVIQNKDVPGTSNNDYVVTVANNTIALTDASIPAGLTVITQILH
jgi:hypothetical protein